MRAISSHRDHRSSKMRFLIVSAILACAAAAPSHFLGPVAVAGIYPAAIPTLSPGDVQAAVIDARVKAQDLAIEAIDKTRTLSEQANENVRSQFYASSDQVKENTQEAFWAAQDKQWQALDALKTAQAKLEGAVASNEPVLAKNTVLGPYIPAVAPVAPISPIAPIVYTPGIVAPVVKNINEPAKIEEAKPEGSQFDQVKENAQEAFWSAQEKQWQALDALKTVQAQLEGAVASNAPALAKNAVLGPYFPAVAPIAPISRIAPIVYTPGIVAPVVKTVNEPAQIEQAKPEAKPEDKNEALTKTAEEKVDERDSVAIEAAKVNLEAKSQLAPVFTPIAIQPYGYPVVAPVPLSPVLKYGTFNQFGLAPTIVKAAW